MERSGLGPGLQVVFGIAPRPREPLEEIISPPAGWRHTTLSHITQEKSKMGGDNQPGHHLPGWGGVLLGKLNKPEPIIAFDHSRKATVTKNNHLSSMRKEHIPPIVSTTKFVK